MADGAILLVEDDPDDLDLTLRELKKGNVANEILVVRDGVQALEHMFGRAEYAGRDVTDIPAVVLLDLKLPRVDGLEVLRRIREDERTRRTPVVVLTSSTRDEDMIESYDLGANSYVCKPVNFEDFKQAVRQLKLYWMLVNNPPPGECGDG